MGTEWSIINKNKLSDDEITEDYVFNYPLKERHEKIIDLLYRMKIMNTKDIEKALGYSYKYVASALKELDGGRFILRKQRPFEDRMAGDKQLYYMLDKAGALFIKDYWGIREDNDIKWSDRENRIKYDFAKHGLKIGEIYARLEEAAREESKKNNNPIEIRNALCDKHLYLKFHHGKEMYFYPDMFFKAQWENNIYSYFVEVDMGSMAMQGESINTTSFDKKVYYYENFKASRKTYFGLDVFPRVLVITTNKKRAKNLAITVREKQEEMGKKDVVFLFTSFKFWKKDPFGRIFIDKNSAEQENAKTLFD